MVTLCTKLQMLSKKIKKPLLLRAQVIKSLREFMKLIDFNLVPKGRLELPQGNPY